MIVQEQSVKTISGSCPVCDGLVTPAEQVEESEIICCSECCSMLVVSSIECGIIVFELAPQVEEDWGQ